MAALLLVRTIKQRWLLSGRSLQTTIFKVLVILPELSPLSFFFPLMIITIGETRRFNPRRV